jgi:hypothetical protein
MNSPEAVIQFQQEAMARALERLEHELGIDHVEIGSQISFFHNCPEENETVTVTSIDISAHDISDDATWPPIFSGSATINIRCDNCKGYGSLWENGGQDWHLDEE